MINAMVLAGGTGSRLGLLTKGVNKHLLPMGDRPVLCHPLSLAEEIGGRILVVTGSDAIGQISRIAGECCFAVQAEPDGIGGAIKVGASFCDYGPVFVILGDNLFLGRSFDQVIDDCLSYGGQDGFGAMIWTKMVKNPTDYGVVDLSQSGVPISIEEKPSKPKSDMAITGAYLFDSMVWEYVFELRKSARGEFEVTDILRRYLNAGRLSVRELTGDWVDIGSSMGGYWKATRTFEEVR